mmetsp:Transcript_14341/g.41816  ORF Transcript_14341/g.41816 Transcript_14341/m.41816 type:complete len:356 (-) Transcript_14341:2023-3090(-)
MSALCLSVIVMNTLPDLGKRRPAAIAALAYAPAKVASMPMTSPVERISGPRSVSQPGNLLNGMTTSLTATWLVGSGSSVRPISGSVLPDMMSDAYFAIGWPTALATNGTVRDARGLASMMYGMLSCTANWMLMSPTTPSSAAIILVHSRICTPTSGLMVCVGMLHAESPEWMPACSMCSITPAITQLPSLSRSASTSSSTARSRYLSTSTGWSWSTSTANVMYRLRSVSLYTISIARPPSTYDGRIITGKPSFFAVSNASASERQLPPAGWRMLSLVSTSNQRSRSSARSIASGGVPQISQLPLPLAAGTGSAFKTWSSCLEIFSGVWPPNDTITPSGRSTSMTFSTSSRVIGSK